MKYTPTKKLDRDSLARLFDEAWEAEVSLDIESSLQIFSRFMENIDANPDFNEYDDLERANLFRYYGWLVSNYGKSKNIPFYQERAKDLLTKSIDLFLKLDLTERALEAEIIAGLCYFYEGAIIESETIFEHISNQFEGNHLHPVYLRAKINTLLLLHWKKEFQKALKVIEEIEIPMEFCKDTRLLTMFHLQAGMIYRGINKFDAAVYQYNKCLEIAQQINHWLLAAKTHNNLAFLYNTLGKFELAHFHIERGIEVLRQLNQTGWIANLLDTKAIIFLAENKFESALKTINEAIDIFRAGEDFSNLTDALWNKVKSLLGLNLKEEAIEVFAELIQIAQIRIGGYAVKQYSKLFSEIIYIKQNDSLENELNRFKKNEITEALRRADLNIAEAAKLLRISNKRQLTEIIDREFPSIYQELGIPRNLKKTEIKEVDTAVKVINEANPKQINQIDLKNVNFTFAGNLKPDSNTPIEMFYFSAEKMSELFGVAEDAVLAIVPDKRVKIREFLLAKQSDGNEYFFSRVLHEPNLDILYLLDDDEPFPLDEVEVIGKPAGYCRFDEVDKDLLIFNALPEL